MVYRMLSVLLCSCLLAGSIPQIVYGAEETSVSQEEETNMQSEEDSEGEPEHEEETPEPEPEPEPPSSEVPPESSSVEESSSPESSSTENSSIEESSVPESSSVEESSSTETSTIEETTTEEKSTKEETEEETTEEETEEETETTKETEEETETTKEETTEEETLPENTTELRYGSFEVVSLQYNAEQWFRFTAPESGTYNFYIDGGSTSDISLSVYDLREAGNRLKSQNYQNTVRYALMYLEKGQTVYSALSLTENGPVVGKQVHFGAKRANIASVEQTEGGYRASTSRFTAQIGWRAASRTVSADMTLTTKGSGTFNESYFWQIRYGSSETGYQYMDQQIVPDVRKEKMIDALDPGVEYRFTMYLINADTLALEAVLVPEAAAIKMQTGSSKENILFRGKRAGYDSITLDIEAVEAVAKYSYGPLAAYEKEVTVQRQISGLASITVSDLEPATTYYFEFYNSSGVTLAYTTVDTKEYPAKVLYSVKPAGPDVIALKADISSYDGKIPESFNLCYEVADADGKMITSGMEKIATKGSEQWTIEASVPDLEHSTEYSVTMWMNEPGYSAHFKQKTLSVKTGKAPFPDDALTVEIAQNTNHLTRADYVVRIAGYQEAVTGKLKYRMKNALGEYKTNSINVRGGRTKGALNGLQEGTEYEYEVRIAGVVCRGFFQMGEARINPVMTDDTGAYDAVLSYRLNPSELTQGVSYSAKLYYYNEETKLYAELRSKLPLTAADNYAISMQAAEYFALSPDTQYGFQWELYEGTTLVNTQYQLVTTEKSETIVELTANMADSITCNIALKGRTEHITRDITLFAYVKEEDGEYRKAGQSFNLYASKGYKTTGYTISGLVDEQNYTVSFRDIKGKEYGVYTFVFDAKIDGVRVSIGNQVAGAHHITLQTQIEGEPAPGSYLILFFKERDEEDWDIRSVLLEENQTECNFELSSYLGDDVNADRIYEFVSGISDVQYPPVTAALGGVCSGEILTQTDGRSLTNVTAGSGYSYISIKAMITNNPINTSSYIYVFYREKGAADWIKSKKSFIVSTTTGGMLTFINDLKPGTEYEYKVAVSDSGYDVMLNEIEKDRQVSGSIMTKAHAFALDITADPLRRDTSGVALKVHADTNAPEKRLKAVLTLDNGETKEVLLQQSKDYSATVAFTDLSPDARYTVTNAQLQVMETITGKCSYVTVASFEPAYEFTCAPRADRVNLVRSYEKKSGQFPLVGGFALHNNLEMTDTMISRQDSF